MCFELDLVMGITANCTAPSSSSKTDMHRIPTPGHVKRQTCLTNYISFITSTKAAYLRTSAFWRRTSPILWFPTYYQRPYRFWRRTSPILRFPTYYQRPYRPNQRQQTPAHSSLPLYLPQTYLRINWSVSNARRNQALPSVVQGLVRHST